MDIGERIKKRRRELDISQEKLAELVDVHENTIRKWEQGTRSPDAQKLNLLASALGTTVGALMGETDNPEPEKTQINLPINSSSAVSEDDLDLGFWGEVASKARRAAKIEDSRKPLVIALLSSALNELTGESISSSINAYNGDNSFYKGNILNTGAVLA